MLNNKDLEVFCEFTKWEYFVVCRALLLRNTRETRRIARELITTFIEDSIQKNKQNDDICEAVIDLAKQFKLNIRQIKVRMDINNDKK